MLDELHEDLNRIVEKPYIAVPELISITNDPKEFMVFKFFDSIEVLVESSSTLGSEYYKTGALQHWQWTLVQTE